jgi:hypothetical protein
MRDAKDQNQPLTFCIESEASVLKIGFSNDFDICGGQNVDRQTSAKETCHNFVNKSVEKLCERHRFAAQTRKLDRFKANRIGLPAERVDLNVIRRQNQ